MGRPITLFTGQWADLPLSELARKVAEWGYDGLELACWGDHFSPESAVNDEGYVAKHRAILDQNGLKVWALGNHLTGQLVLDPNDHRTDDWVPSELAGDSEGKRAWAIEQMKLTAKAARKFGVGIVTGFTGSPIWHMIYPFPPVSPKDIQDGYDTFAKTWGPILDVFKENDVKFALEVHPGEIAFDLYSAELALEAVGNHPAFGFNFDPSHLIWQQVDPVQFIYAFPDRIFHVHAKDAEVTLDGRTGILSSHLQFGDHRRGWDFRSVGRGDVDFAGIVKALNHIGYTGPLSVEWEDNHMEREHGAREACEFLRQVDFPPAPGGSFEDAFKK